MNQNDWCRDCRTKKFSDHWRRPRKKKTNEKLERNNFPNLKYKSSELTYREVGNEELSDNVLLPPTTISRFLSENKFYEL
ncbi:hypothetical protein WA026_003833 [Henosepilachna vigintioctopunctata]|uniref:Uncharacterized protein n=1 Tax=Henosepilachna vigintioctopunctata TaxID=420089 RepID=A0AAW1UFU9_9CUCU